MYNNSKVQNDNSLYPSSYHKSIYYQMKSTETHTYIQSSNIRNKYRGIAMASIGPIYHKSNSIYEQYKLKLKKSKEIKSLQQKCTKHIVKALRCNILDLDGHSKKIIFRILIDDYLDKK